MNYLYLSLLAAALSAGPERIIPAPAEARVLEGTCDRPGMVGCTIGAESFRKETEKRGLKGFSAREAYRITVSGHFIRIEANTETGAFYARKSLEQMLSAGEPLAQCEIFDYPRFAWRGLMYDESRNFQSKEFILKQLDAMALLKLNRLHLHLTDGAGWRLESEAYPLLHTFAAWRTPKTFREWNRNPQFVRLEEPDPHLPAQGGAFGGYFTAGDIREILRYAAARHIQVIPEIDLPGHSLEVTTAYPELGCTGAPYVHEDLCLGNPETLTFAFTVLEELMDLFPSEYIHIGGDEAEMEAWKTCPKCQGRMAKEGIETVEGLQSWFIGQLDRFIAARGRKMLGWDEILMGGLAEGATVMSWRGTAGGIKAMEMGHDVVMTPAGVSYIQRFEDPAEVEPHRKWFFLPLNDVYLHEPVEASMTPAMQEHLLGVQGCVWTEFVETPERAEELIYPRLFAIAERGWALPENKDLERFRERTVRLISYFHRLGYRTFDLSKETLKQ